jgi:hypothetical protein
MKKNSGRASNGRPSRNGQSGRNGRRSPDKRPGEVEQFLLEALETELGGVEVYETALECVIDEDLRQEWEKYLDQTREHVATVTDLCHAFGVDPNMDTPGRQVTRWMGKSLVKAMTLALGSGSPEAAQVVAAECVVHAETKDHMNWGLMKRLSAKMGGEGGKRMAAACERHEDEEDEHLYHSQGWARELKAATLGMDAQLPPPEEERDVKTAIGAARAKAASSR